MTRAVQKREKLLQEGKLPERVILWVCPECWSISALDDHPGRGRLCACNAEQYWLEGASA